MDKYWELYKSKDWVEPFLIYSIVLFTVLGMILFLLVMLSRQKYQKEGRLKVEYREIAEKLLLTILFNDVHYADIIRQEPYNKLISAKLFRKVLMKSVINLHHNYEGAYAAKLERFYSDSGLMADSFKKLKNRRWEVKGKAITELAEMNVENAFGILMSLSQSRNNILKATALNACIKLNGTNGILHLTSHPDPIDEWTQINIINALKKRDIEDTQGIELLLESKNSTVIRLGLKIISTLHLSNKAGFISQLIENAPSNAIKFEAQAVMEAFTTNSR